MQDKIIPLKPSTIETIDLAIYDLIDNKFDLHTKANDGFKKVPVLWISPERAYHIKRKDIRDSVGKLKLPLITIQRKSFEKDFAFKGGYQAHDYPTTGQGDYTKHPRPVAKRIMQRSTRKFSSTISNLKSNEHHSPIESPKVVYEELYMPIPVWVKVGYTITLSTEYQQQMNDLVTPFATKTGQLNALFARYDGHRYETFIEGSMAQENNSSNLGEEERKFKTTIELRVLGYLLGDGENEEAPKIIKKESIVDVKISRERVIVGEEKPWERDTSREF
jgi:hypothetical protein